MRATVNRRTRSTPAAGALQAAHGISDSPERALEDWLAVGGPSADVAWAQRYLEASVPEVFDYLTAAGVHWLGARPQEGNRVPRWHAPAAEPVPGLFVAGEVAGMAGGHINGQAALEGTMLGPSLFSGRVAGRVV